MKQVGQRAPGCRMPLPVMSAKASHFSRGWGGISGFGKHLHPDSDLILGVHALDFNATMNKVCWLVWSRIANSLKLLAFPPSRACFFNI